MTKEQPSGPSTRSLHGGRGRHPHGGLAPPLFPAAVNAFGSLEETIATFEGRREGTLYARFGHPTGLATESRLAALEGAEDAVLCSSGMAAVALTLSAVCRTGDHVLASLEQYGGVAELLRRVGADWGLQVDFLPLEALGDLGPRMRDTTRLVLLESPTNPLVRLVDFRALMAGLERAPHRPVLALDATLATPLGQDSLGAGFDLVLHSATKYLGGHDDLTAGVVLGSRDRTAPIRERRRMLGANCDPETAWLLDRGLMTLAIRWERQCANALELARRLEAHPKVTRVFHPGLPSHPHHELARRQMRAFGAILAFEVQGGFEAARRTFDRLQLIARAPSLGGVESMVLHPATSSHRSLSEAARREIGITDGLLRMSAGIEDVPDLWRDLEEALA